MQLDAISSTQGGADGPHAQEKRGPFPHVLEEGKERLVRLFNWHGPRGPSKDGGPPQAVVRVLLRRWFCAGTAKRTLPEGTSCTGVPLDLPQPHKGSPAPWKPGVLRINREQRAERFSDIVG
jgi:hypothetical protein